MKTYYVQTSALIEITADSVEEAMDKAKELAGSTLVKYDTVLGWTDAVEVGFVENLYVNENTTKRLNE